MSRFVSQLTCLIAGSPLRLTVLTGCWLTLACVFSGEVRAQDPFVIEVLDSQTGRGIPLVKVTAGGTLHYTDSNGIVAFDEPGLMNQNITFLLNSYGYTSSIRTLQTTPNITSQVNINRTQLAERLYRVTGTGIYQDSVLVGHSVPIDEPLLNANVKGQDSVQSTVYHDQIHWFWGDTLYEVGFGNFRTSGATSQLPGQGGLDPSLGVNLDYYVDGNGSSKQMMPLTDPGPVWIDGLFTVDDNNGQEKMLTHYSRRDPNNALGAQVEHGLALFNDTSEIFERHQTHALDNPITAGGLGHSFKHSVDGEDYIYFALSYPNVRVRATWDDVNDVSTWEAFTPLLENSRYDAANPPLELDGNGKPVYGWKKNTDPLTADMVEELVQNGFIDRDESPFRLQDSATGDDIHLHRASVYWNDYRHNWIMIGNEVFGDSLLGEVWFAEAPTPEGPWENAVKVATHHNGSENYTFYNPKQEPFFDQDGGRTIYLEGTYSNTFSGNPNPTPLYDYNEIMYRLDLSTIPSLVAPTLLGDYNGDGTVDAADYSTWRDAMTIGGVYLLNDSTPGTLDESDFAFWRDHFGDTLNAGSAAAAIPEPSAVLLATVAVGMAWGMTRSQRHERVR
jgi:hypothetical protein